MTRTLRTIMLLGAATIGLVLAAAVLATSTDTTSPGARIEAVQIGDSPENTPLRALSIARTSGGVPSDLHGLFNDLAGTADMPEQVQNGAMRLAEGRLLLSGLGTTNARLYAMPTTKGRVCYVLTGGPASCAGAFAADRPVGIVRFDPDALDSGLPMSVFGLTANNVRAVDIVVAGVTYRAQLANNAYFFEVPTAGSQPESLRVTFRSGKTTVLSLGEIRDE